MKLEKTVTTDYKQVPIYRKQITDNTYQVHRNGYIFTCAKQLVDIKR